MKQDFYTGDARTLENNVPFVIRQSSYLYCQLHSSTKCTHGINLKGICWRQTHKKWFGKRHGVQVSEVSKSLQGVRLQGHSFGFENFTQAYQKQLKIGHDPL